MKKLINELLRKKIGIEIRKCKPKPNAITLKPEGISKGDVLLAYIIDPFLVEDESLISNHHTNHWESYLIAKAFLQMGYTVDVISYLDDKFIPLKTKIETSTKKVVDNYKKPYIFKLNQKCSKVLIVKRYAKKITLVRNFAGKITPKCNYKLGGYKDNGGKNFINQGVMS